ncbi:MAG: hypothetical protein QOC98_2413 [Frankiaceae bacterium]|nr:hypothetical protein [Frankiaceae bacterium]
MRSPRKAAWVAVPALLVALAGCSGTSNAGYASDPPPPTYGASSKAKTNADDYGVQTPSRSTVPTQQATTSRSAPAPAPTPTQVDAPTSAAFDGLKPGDKGSQVQALQVKLQSLGFWVGSTDGSYGQTTSQAVMAVQKAAGLKRDGVMGSETRKALADGVSVAARSTSGRWIEIDKGKQLVKVVDDGQVQTILNTSTGSGETYTSEGQTSVANTPSGKFEMFRQIDAMHKSPLGLLWRPKFFNGGIALHGSESIPAYPASHGCVRLSNAAMNWVWDTGQAPIGTNVWVY